jgi:hypothetical protein
MNHGRRSTASAFFNSLLGLLALFTHIHLFWIAGLMLALIDLPDFSTPLRSIAGSVEKIAGSTEEEPLAEAQEEMEVAPTPTIPEKAKSSAPKAEVHSRA